MDLPTIAVARQDLEPYLLFFREVPVLGWARTLAEGPAWMDTTTRKNMCWDAMCDLAKHKAPDFGLKIVVLHQGRALPLVRVPGKHHEYLVQFNNLTNELKAGGWDTEQRQLFEAQRPVQQQLPCFDPLVYLRAGYVLDELGVAVVRTPVLLSYQNRPLWVIDPPGDEGSPPAPLIPINPMPKRGLKISSTAKPPPEKGKESDGHER